MNKNEYKVFGPLNLEIKSEKNKRNKNIEMNC